MFINQLIEPKFPYESARNPAVSSRSRNIAWPKSASLREFSVMVFSKLGISMLSTHTIDVGSLMLVAITGFGVVWRRRFGNDASDPERFSLATFYNTTGVLVAVGAECGFIFALSRSSASPLATQVSSFPNFGK